MSLKHKQKVYLSLDSNLLNFVEEKSQEVNITRSKFIRNLLIKEYKHFQRKKIEKIIEGENSN